MCSILLVYNPSSLPRDQDLKDVEREVLIAERILLQTLCFDVQIIHPYVGTLNKIKLLRGELSSYALY